MSLVDSSHIRPTRGGRHGAHYKLFSRKHDGKEVPGMIFKYEGLGDGWECHCGRRNFSFADRCLCKRERPVNARPKA